MQRDNFTCQACGDTENELHVHHLIYEKGKKPFEANNDNLITYCKICHELYHKMISEIRRFYSKSDFQFRVMPMFINEPNCNYFIMYYGNLWLITKTETNYGYTMNVEFLSEAPFLGMLENFINANNTWDR